MRLVVKRSGTLYNSKKQSRSYTDSQGYLCKSVMKLLLFYYKATDIQCIFYTNYGFMCCFFTTFADLINTIK